MSSRVVSQYDLALITAKQFDVNAGMKSADLNLMHRVIMKLLTTIGKFVSHTFNKAQEKPGTPVISDVAQLGQFVCLRSTDSGELLLDFLPTIFASQEMLLPRKSASTLIGEKRMDEMYKRELSLGKLSEVCNIDVDQSSNIMTALIK